LLVKYGLLSAIGILLALLALWWVQPQTAAGQSLLAIIVFGFVNGIGAITWRKKPSEP
jgi:TRAP-type uncharacterized transport system fused permease subunit